MEFRRVLFRAEYKKNSYSIEEYRRLVLSNYDEICLDGGLKLQTENISDIKTENSYKVFNPKKNNFKKLSIIKSFLYYQKNYEINFIPGGQGMKVFNNTYKIIWKTRFNNIFQFSSEKDLIFNGNQSLLISSNNKKEILFLLSLLNSKINLTILSRFKKIPNESKYIVSLTSIKEFIRIPKINDNNQIVKDEIIKQTEYLLSLEDYQLKDFVEFTTTIQKFSDIEVDPNNLILVTKKGEKIKQRIKANHELVISSIDDRLKNEIFKSNEISLQDLKYMEIIDTQEQELVKKFIDDLVFALYFNIPIENVGINKKNEIKEICSKSEYYLAYSEQLDSD